MVSKQYGLRKIQISQQLADNMKLKNSNIQNNFIKIGKGRTGQYLESQDRISTFIKLILVKENLQL